MPLNVPNLDDLSYADLVQEGLALIPRYAPEWTDRNASDPGITLIELLAYVSELLIYRLNRVTRENKTKFLALLTGLDQRAMPCLSRASTADLDRALRWAVLELRRRRAVTAADYEALAREAVEELPATTAVIRAKCLLRSNLEAPADAGHDSPGHVSVVVVPRGGLARTELSAVLDRVRRYLEARRLLTTRLHVIGPRYVWLSLGARLHCRPGVAFEAVRDRAIDTLTCYFDPLVGGSQEQKGWPFGQTIYLSQVYELLESVEGIDYVADVRVLRFSALGAPEDEALTAVGTQIGVRSTVGVDSRLGTASREDTQRLVRDAAGRLVAIALKPHELVKLALYPSDFRLGRARVKSMSEGV